MTKLIVLLGLSVFLATQNSFASDTLSPPRRAHHALVYDDARRVVLMTAGSTPTPDEKSFVFFNDVWTYDGKRWEKTGTAGDERSGIALTYDSKRNRIVSFGGYANGSSLGDLRVLKGNSWTVLSNNPEMAAAEAGLVYDIKRDRLIAFGGSKGQRQLHATTWEWDGAKWTDTKAVGPEGRQAFVMGYDSKRSRTVVFGGLGQTPGQRLNDTWEYDGTRWTKMDSTGPGPRASAGAAYDSRAEMLIIFGGFGADTTYRDTWGWDGKNWRKLADSGPPSRSMGYMAYDHQRQRVVMFGGRIGWPNDANDTWEWDGKSWQER